MRVAYFGWGKWLNKNPLAPSFLIWYFGQKGLFFLQIFLLRVSEDYIGMALVY